MEIIPAVDVLGGQVVRLHQGRYDEVTHFEHDPAELARRFEADGAKRLHVVDLDGARAGSPGNIDVIERILKASSLTVQVGGGIRNLESAQRWLEAGASRVVIGTAAVKDPAMVRTLCERREGAVVIALDAKQGEIALEGWTEGSGIRVEDLAVEVDGWGIGAVLFTAIEKDGTGAGPDVAATAALQKRLKTTVIASGGIGSLDHVRALSAAGLRATVIGRALLQGTFTLKEAIAASAEGSA